VGVPGSTGAWRERNDRTTKTRGCLGGDNRIPNRWPVLAKEIARLSDAVEKLRAHRRHEGEHGERILARLVAIERQLGLREGITIPKAIRR
jgi:hypothetical protein